MRHLGFVCAADSEALVAMLRRSPILRQLTTLDLRGGVLGEAAAFVTARARFAHLELLDLRWNTLTIPDAALAEALPQARIDPQRWDDHTHVPRFNACME